MLRISIAVLSGILFVVAWTRTSALEPTRQRGLLPTQPPIPYVRYIPEVEPLDRVVVVHGLDSNKEFMNLFCAALADAGFDVYAIDLPGHGDSRAPFNAVLAGNVLEQAISQLHPGIAVGHSMGGSLLVDLAHHLNFRAMVLMSPAPTPLDAVELPNTLVITGQFDIPAMNAFVPHLAGVEWWKFNWGTHSSVLINPAQIDEIVKWLGGRTNRVRTRPRISWLALMFAAGAALGIALLPPRITERMPVIFSLKELLVVFVAACGAAVVLLRYVIVLRWLRLFAMDYLVSFLFVAGIVLMLLACWRDGSIFSRVKGFASGHVFAISKAVAAAAYVIIVLGLLAGSHLIHMTLSNGRWWRFPVIAAASFPLFLFDEIAVRQVWGTLKSAISGLLTRSLLAAAMATGALVLNRESSFLVLLIGLMLLFWIVLWFCSHIVARHVQNPVAAALFSALIQGWMFAAWFVTV